MSAAEIAESRRALAEAGRHLRRRHAAEILDALAQVLELWRDADSPPREALAKQLPEETGFHEAVVREGLARGLEPWSRDALLALVESELGGRAGLERAHGFDTTAVVLAGSIPMPTLLAILTPLVLRSPVLVKPASRDGVTPSLVRKALAMVDPELADCVALAAFPRDDEASREALLEAPCVVASGSDETIAALAAAVQPSQRFLGYGHRLSLAALGPGLGGGAGLAEAIAALALDVALWDQEGCLSPVALFVVGDARAAGAALADALAEISGRLPRGRLDAETHGRVNQEREAAELRAAAGEAVTLHAGDGFSVVVEADSRPRPAPLGRFVRVHPVAEPAALAGALAPYSGHLAAVAQAGFEGPLALPGAPRLCPFGQLQTPPLSWRRDGRHVLRSLAHTSDSTS